MIFRPLVMLEIIPQGKLSKNVIVRKVSCDCNYHHVSIITGKRPNTVGVFFCSAVTPPGHQNRGFHI